MGSTSIFAGNTTGRRDLIIRLNGSTRIAAQVWDTNQDGNQTDMSVTTIYDLGVNDYAELTVVQTSGGSLNIEYVANFTPEFAMAKVLG